MFSFNSKKLVALVSSILFILLLNGCGMYRNFTTYFNTYYNAKSIFDQVEEDLQKKKVDVFAFREDLQNNQMMGGQPSSYQQNSGYRSGQQPGSNQFNRGSDFGSNQYGGSQFSGQSGGSIYSGDMHRDLTKVIEKCSKILQYEKESSYFPDALFMTGKALYYQQEYSKAQRKFTELAGLAENDYAHENKLWLAKTNLQLRNFDEGLQQLQEVIKSALEEEEERLFTEASITKISFLIFRNEIPSAVNECKEYLKASNDDEMKALVSYQLGKLQVELSDEQSALETFASVLEFGPTLDVEVKSRLEHARLLKDLDKAAESEEELTDMRNQGKFKNNLDEINIDLAQIYFESNRGKEAVELLKDVDTTYRALPTSGIACVKLGEVYEYAIRDYDSSHKYYNKAVLSLAPRDYKNLAADRAKNFERYFNLKKEMRENEKKLVYIKDPRIFERDSIDYAIAFKEYDEEKKRLEEQNKASANQMNTMQESQEAQRRQMEQQQKQLELEKEIERKKRLGINEPIPLKILIQLGKAVKPEKPQEDEKSLSEKFAANLYNQGSLFFSEMDYPDSAFYYFNKVIKETPNAPVVPQTLFSLATYYETKNDTVQADTLYKKIYDNYPKDKLYQVAGEKLGLIKNEEKKVVTKTDDPAEPLYNKAEEFYYNKNFTEAIDSFKSIQMNFPKSPYASKAIYYAGMIYEEQKNYDSAAVAYAILAKDFAAEPVARLGVPKYEEYKNEKEKKKREEEEKKLIEEKKKKEAEDKLKAEQAKLEENKADQTVPEVKDSKEINDSSNVLKDDSRKKQSYLDRLKAESDTTKKKIAEQELSDEVSKIARPKTDTSKVKKATEEVIKPKTPAEKSAVKDSLKRIIKE